MDVVIGFAVLGAIVYVFLRFSREGQWIGWFGRTVVHFVRTGEWDDF